MLRVSPRIAIPDHELVEHFIRASGPGGQKVNKVATAVELRFDIDRSASLPPGVAERLKRIAGRRVTKDGVLVLRAERFRTQERNRADARERLVRLIRRAAVPAKPRLKTKPTRASIERHIPSSSTSPEGMPTSISWPWPR